MLCVYKTPCFARAAVLYFESILCSAKFGNCQATVQQFFLIAGLLRAFINKLCCVLNLQEGTSIVKDFLKLVGDPVTHPLILLTLTCLHHAEPSVRWEVSGTQQ